MMIIFFFFFSSRRRHTRCLSDWSSDVCSSDLLDEAAFRTLWTALVQSIRVISPVMPFLAEQLWQRLVRDVADGAPDSVFLARWPEPAAALADEELVASMGEVRRVAALGHQARAS